MTDHIVPSPGPGQLLLQLKATGLCMSDHHVMVGDLGAGLMSSESKCAGHEGAGVVVALGEGVNDWKVGDRGGVKPLWDVCHTCQMCRSGNETYCRSAVHTGAMVTGTYSEVSQTSTQLCLDHRSRQKMDGSLVRA